MEQKAWFKEAVVYQIYPRSFMDSNGDGIGDINGIISKLDYIKELGVNVIWLSPVYCSPNYDNGYDISDYQNIMVEFGTLEDWERLLDEMHKRGLKLVMDLVVNHTSHQHPWFLESRKSKDNPYHDYYIWRDTPPNDWRSIFGFSAWKYDEQLEQYYLHLFCEEQPDLNWDNPKVRDEVYQMMKFWLDKGIDGFRMDVINLIGKPDDLAVNGEVFEPYLEKTHRYVQEMNRKVLSHYDIMTVGETAMVTPGMAEDFTASDRKELNMVFQFEHVTPDTKAAEDKWTDQPIDMYRTKQVMSKWQTQLSDKAWNSLYFSNHDQPRQVSRFGNDSEEYRTLSAKMLATMLHTLKGTPYIYQGEELGMSNMPFKTIEDFRDVDTLNYVKEQALSGNATFETLLPALRAISRDNARTPMQWDNSKNAGFTSGTPWIPVNPNYLQINAEKEMHDPNSVFCYYQKLISLRQKHSIFVYGKFTEYLANHRQVFCYTRTYGGEKMLVLLNMTGEACTVSIPSEAMPLQKQRLIANYPSVSSDATLRPYEAVVYLGSNQ